MDSCRRSGVLLHITSLPGPLPNGVLGEEAIALMDGMAASGTRVWQFLPMGPTHGHGSPYESLSTFAGNPEWIDLRLCVEDGWLDDAVLQRVMEGSCSMAEARKLMVVPFCAQLARDDVLISDWNGFIAESAFWLEDYASFYAIRQQFDDLPWWQWPQPLCNHDAVEVSAFVERNNSLFMQAKMEQFLFARQWQQLRAAAKARGIVLFGDLPIYVAHDSADVWAHRELFTVNEEGLCDEVAGVPPDYFSADGQRWGNPLYRWQTLQARDFSWWVERVRCQRARVDWLRIDHFRGLESYWAIPGARKDGRIGEWQPAPGAALLETLHSQLGALPLVAEDLGLITDEVHALRSRFGLPGMKILQFAFGGDASNPYLPHNHSEDMVVYTGTHDNDTTAGWWQKASPSERAHLRRYFAMKDVEAGDAQAGEQHGDDRSGGEIDAAQVTMVLTRQTLASVARLAIIPLQDLLGLGSDARLNTPGTLDGNWVWRLTPAQFSSLPWDRLRIWNDLYGRG